VAERKRSELDLLRIHVDAMYVHDQYSRIESINDWSGGVAPRFYLGRTREGNLWRFRSDLADEVVDELLGLCREEPAPTVASAAPDHRAEYLRILASHTPIETVYAGPTYWFPAVVAPEHPSVIIDSSNMRFLCGGLDEWIPDVAHQRPFMARIVDERAVSVCASVRISAKAHAAGVETLSEFRRQGYAVDVVGGWACEVSRLGAIPLYSTSWDNPASQGVAAKLGLSMFGNEFHVT